MNQGAITELVPARKIPAVLAVSPGDRKKRFAGPNDVLFPGRMIQSGLRATGSDKKQHRQKNDV